MSRRILFLASLAAIHSVRWIIATYEKGFEVHVLSLTEPTEPIPEGISTYVPRSLGKLGYFTAALQGRRLVRDLRPDLVHAHYATGYGLLARLIGFHPTILSVWGADVYDFPIKSPLHRRLVIKNLHFPDRLLSTSEVMRREIGKYSQRPVDVTPFGVDMQRFQNIRACNELGKEPIVIGTVKTLDDKYGIDDLLWTFQMVRNKNRNLQLRLLIVGEGPKEEELKSLARELSIADVTTFQGPVSHAEVPEYLNKLSIAVFLSTLDSESFGVAVIEAGACERPVIVSDVGGLPEVVEDGVTGIIVPRRRPDLAAEAIERLLKGPALRKRMGQAARARVATLYDWPQNVAQMMQIYEELLP